MIEARLDNLENKDDKSKNDYLKINSINLIISFKKNNFCFKYLDNYIN